MSTETKRAPHNPNADLKVTACTLLAASMGGGGIGRAIEESERAGQASLVNSDTLPTRFSGREALEAAGVKFGAEVAGDSMFTYVELPAGWKKQRTDHAMWSDLVDDKGRKRAIIFYKAAFYDRSAHGSVLARLNVASYYNEDHETIAVARVEDQGAVLFESERLEMKTDADRYGSRWDAPVKVQSKREIAHAQCVAWLDQNYPDWKNPAAYWD